MGTPNHTDSFKQKDTHLDELEMVLFIIICTLALLQLVPHVCPSLGRIGDMSSVQLAGGLVDTEIRERYRTRRREFVQVDAHFC